MQLARNLLTLLDRDGAGGGGARFNLVIGKLYIKTQTGASLSYLPPCIFRRNRNYSKELIIARRRPGDLSSFIAAGRIRYDCSERCTMGIPTVFHRDKE